MQLWNSRTRTKEVFQAGPIVRVYVCGITPYATTHLGHARTYLIFDVLMREIERRGHVVRYAQNVTDVDDPLFDKAQQLGISVTELAQECTRIFQDDLAALRIRPPDFYPRASDEIGQMLEMIGTLVEGGHAYHSGNKVYYRVQSFSTYGSFSRLSREQMLAVAADRGEDPTDPAKEDPLDFVLWKPSRTGEASWPSPWGTGRPGWHIECSAMATHYLGPLLDIHGGGSDLIYPHHEHEIAQTEAATGQAPFARYWMHAEMVQLGGIKMSKSLGNLILVRELRRRVDPLAVRHYLLSTHYRDFLDYSENALQLSREKLEVLQRALRGPSTRPNLAELTMLEEHFDRALSDDLDTPAALTALDSVARLVLGAPVDEGTGEAQRRLHVMAVRLGLD